MKSFDVWDTLIGRWYYDPLTNFDEMGKSIQFENFTYYRKHSEELSQLKTLEDIYLTFQKITGISDQLRSQLPEIEFVTERDHTFRIEPILSDFDSNSIVVSDFYFSPDKLVQLLNHHQIFPVNAYVTYNGKLSGRIWSVVTGVIDLHTGDSYEADFRIPQLKGVKARHITITRFNSLESWLYGRAGCQRLSCLSRAVRLSKPLFMEPHLQNIWDEACSLNIPVLIMLAYYLKEFCRIHNFDKLLFTERDCIYLKRIFNAIFPDFNTDSFMTSREAYQTSSEDFTKYVQSVYTPDSLIVDLQGTGDSCFNFFVNSLGTVPNYFTVVNSDRTMKRRSTIYSLVSWADGYSDRIERLNYANLGRILDVQGDQHIPLRATHTSLREVELQSEAVDLAVKFINSGFILDLVQQDELSILLRHMDQTTPEIVKHVNHEVF